MFAQHLHVNVPPSKFFLGSYGRGQRGLFLSVLFTNSEVRIKIQKGKPGAATLLPFTAEPRLGGWVSKSHWKLSSSTPSRVITVTVYLNHYQTRLNSETLYYSSKCIDFWLLIAEKLKDTFESAKKKKKGPVLCCPPLPPAGHLSFWKASQRNTCAVTLLTAAQKALGVLWPWLTSRISAYATVAYCLISPSVELFPVPNFN